MNSITFNYITNEDDSLKSLPINLESYFEIDSDEQLSINSNPLHSQPYQYLSIPKGKLRFIDVQICINMDKIEFKQTFWNDGENFLTEMCTINNGNEKCRELITTIKLDKMRTHISRFRFNKNIIVPLYTGIIFEDEEMLLKEEAVDLNDFNKFI